MVDRNCGGFEPPYFNFCVDFQTPIPCDLHGGCRGLVAVGGFLGCKESESGGEGCMEAKAGDGRGRENAIGGGRG